jgi:hypothetical protein
MADVRMGKIVTIELSEAEAKHLLFLLRYGYPMDSMPEELLTYLLDMLGEFVDDGTL